MRQWEKGSTPTQLSPLSHNRVGEGYSRMGFRWCSRGRGLFGATRFRDLMSRPRAVRHLYLANPAFENVLVAELRAARARPEPLTAGVIATAQGPLLDPCFARQVLPNARAVSGRGPSDVADAVLSSLHEASALSLYERGAELHVFAPDFYRKGSGPPVPHPLAGRAEAVLDVLEKKIEGRARKRGIPRRGGAPERLVQVLLTGHESAYVSDSALERTDPLRAWPARFAAGRAPIEEHRDAPSSAYKKLDEALAWLNVMPAEDDVVLDLGAAPGGWTFVALAYGAHVIAFDRAKLDARLEAHPRVQHLRKDAFTEAPLDEASWLLCDVIDAPARSLDLVRRALAQPKMRAVVVTVKLTRPVDVGVLREAQALVEGAQGFRGRVKNLVHNKCEVTVMLRRG